MAMLSRNPIKGTMANPGPTSLRTSRVDRVWFPTVMVNEGAYDLINEKNKRS